MLQLPIDTRIDALGDQCPVYIKQREHLAG